MWSLGWSPTPPRRGLRHVSSATKVGWGWGEPRLGLGSMSSLHMCCDDGQVHLLTQKPQHFLLSSSKSNTYVWAGMSDSRQDCPSPLVKKKKKHGFIVSNYLLAKINDCFPCKSGEHMKCSVFFSICFSYLRLLPWSVRGKWGLLKSPWSHENCAAEPPAHHMLPLRKIQKMPGMGRPTCVLQALTVTALWWVDNSVGVLDLPKVILDLSKVIFWMKPGAFPSAWGGDLTLSLLCWPRTPVLLPHSDLEGSSSMWPLFSHPLSQIRNISTAKTPVSNAMLCSSQKHTYKTRGDGSATVRSWGLDRWGCPGMVYRRRLPEGWEARLSSARGTGCWWKGSGPGQRPTSGLSRHGSAARARERQGVLTPSLQTT